MITKRQIRFAALISIALHLLFAFGITSILAYKRSMPPINDDFEKAINIRSSNYFSSWAQYSILIPDELDRDKLIDDLNKKGIPSMVYYKIPVHLQKGYKKYGYSRGDFKITEDISNRILSLPMHPYLNKEDQNQIISVLNKYS